MKRNLIILGGYTVMFAVLLIPFIETTMQAIFGGIILAFFGSLINDFRK